jgi:hypothetical protein
MQPTNSSNTKPNDTYELRRIILEVGRELVAKPGRWHACPSRACRRHRGCKSHGLDCARTALSPERQATALAQLRQALGEQGE